MFLYNILIILCLLTFDHVSGKCRSIESMPTSIIIEYL